MANENMVVKPCDVPCPKCGSSDVLRRFREAGKKWDLALDGEYYNKFANRSSWRMEASRDHIDHHCRCCQAKWQTLPLRKTKRVKGAESELFTALGDLLTACLAHDAANNKQMIDPHAEDAARAAIDKYKAAHA